MASSIENLFNEIYDRTQHRILVYITGKCHRVEDISDIFQDTYMELFLVLQKKDWAEIRNEEAFLIKLAKSKIYKHYTLLERIKNFFSREWDAGTDTDVEEADLSLSPEEMAVQQSMIEQTHKYLQSKDELTKKIFYLYYYEEVTIPRIARTLSVKESTVKNRLYRTLKELRFYLERSGDV